MSSTVMKTAVVMIARAFHLRGSGVEVTASPTWSFPGLFLPGRVRNVRQIVALSGGVGGARFLRGLVRATDPAGLTVIGNVGDDVEVLGLHVSPDLDSILYALAGVADEERGWGRADETWVAFEEAR